jgi:uncharacterized integral membrane protein
MNVPVAVARKRLAALWFAMAAALFLIVIAASINRSPETVRTLWSWFLPAVVPTLSLIIGVLVAEHLGKGFERREVDGFLLGLVSWLSAGYLLLVAAALVFELLDWLSLEASQLYLAPFQGLVATALSAFFVQKDAKPNDDDRPVAANLPVGG